MCRIVVDLKINNNNNNVLIFNLKMLLRAVLLFVMLTLESIFGLIAGKKNEYKLFLRSCLE